MKCSWLYIYWKNNLSCLYNGRLYNFGYLSQKFNTATAKEAIQECNWDFATWLSKSKEAGHLLVQAVHNPFARRVIDWDGSIQWNNTPKKRIVGPFITDCQAIREQWK